MEDGEINCEGEENEEVLFFEDRTPTTGPSNNVVSKAQNSEPQDFISFEPSVSESPMSPEDVEKGSMIQCDETDTKLFSKNLELNKEINEGGNDEDTLFVVEDRNPQLTELGVTISPRYSINANFLNRNDDATPSQKRNKLSNTCWNCGETTHALRDCPEPRNHWKIAQSRQEFQNSRPRVVYKRYHVEESQVFGHLVPGQLSKALRKALGLEKKQLPLHIYNMRRLGYPPGWLLEAKVSHSGISMFDGQGKEVGDPGDEAGEVVEEGSKDKYDIRKIVRYPGFNVPAPHGSYDDSGYWGCPPQSQSQSVEAMLAKLEGRFVGGYKRKKMSLNVTGSEDDNSQSAESQDMEYEETPVADELPEDHCKFVPPLPDQILPPPPPSDLPSEESDANISVDETSLSELEEAKKQLLAKLNDTSPVCGTPESRVGKVKSVDLGTPLLKSVSPFARLPAADKFSVNICDVINFENLPDSTGKYEKMSGIIRKVRVELSKMNDDL